MAVNWRYLPFNLRWLTRLEWPATGDDCEGASPVVFPEDADEKIDLIFSISLNEFTQLLSATEKGASLSYPDNEWNVIWSFLRAFECPMAICEAIINCINSDPDTRNTIINMLLADEAFQQGIKDLAGGSILPPTIVTKPIVDTCVEDELFGAVSYIVNAMNTNNEDMFELAEVGTNDEERIALLIEAIPMLAEVAPAEAIDFAQGLLENLSENYSAQWTTVVKDKIRCELFCRALDNDCQITIALLHDYFAERAGSSVGLTNTITNVLEFIVTGSWSGSQVVDMAFFLQIASMRYGLDFLGIGVYNLETQAQLGKNNPDHDWAILPCEECPEDSEECVIFEMDTQLGTTAGYDTGVYVRAGQEVTITTTGSFIPYDGGDTFGPEGHTVSQPGFISETIVVYANIVKILGEEEWRYGSTEITFTAPISGKLYSNVNTFNLDVVYAGHEGVFTLEICVPPLDLELVPSDAIFAPHLELISQGADEVTYEAETTTTGHYTVFGGFEKNATVFYVKAVQIIDASPGWSGNTIGLSDSVGSGLYKAGEIPMNFPATRIWIERVEPDKKIRFTLTTIVGTSSYAPLTGP